jgi:hypothetical protein
MLCALRVLCANRRQFLWIDALCINQEDDRQRGHQVEMMGSVYLQASEVLIWLGTPDIDELEDERLDVACRHPKKKPVPAFQLLETMPHGRD